MATPGSRPRPRAGELSRTGDMGRPTLKEDTKKTGRGVVERSILTRKNGAKTLCFTCFLFFHLFFIFIFFEYTGGVWKAFVFFRIIGQ